jgi:branched-chain amino acid transport system substrate-binding protein
VLGDLKFGAKGEWAQSRMLAIQFHDIKGNDIEQFRTMGTQTVLTPVEYKSGDVIYPYEKAREPAGGAMARNPAPSTTGTK